jgi:hypothetical protein
MQIIGVHGFHGFHGLKSQARSPDALALRRRSKTGALVEHATARSRELGALLIALLILPSRVRQTAFGRPQGEPESVSSA